VAKPNRAGAGQGEFEPHGRGVGGDLRGDLVPGPVAAAGDGLGGVRRSRRTADAGGCSDTARSGLRSSIWVMVNRLSSAWPATSRALTSAAKVTFAPRYSPATHMRPGRRSRRAAGERPGQVTAGDRDGQPVLPSWL
jgi:hypothetical protein